MNRLFAGFSRVNVTPMLGIGISGYYKPRCADGVLDELECSALALSVGDTRVVLMSLDNCEMNIAECDLLRAHAARANALPTAQVFLHTTHTHTSPFVVADGRDALEKAYFEFLKARLADAVALALDDLKPARMGWAVGRAHDFAHSRRYRMKDGSVRTNPGVGNPDAVSPIGEMDERVNLLRFDRENAPSIALVNVGGHPDTIGGNKLSADWPGFIRRTLERALENCACVFFNGAEGDVGHFDAHCASGDLNDAALQFDDVYRGYGRCRSFGQNIAGAVLQVYGVVNYVDVDSLRVLSRTIELPANLPTAEELARARQIEALHRAGRDDELPYKGMMLTTVVAEAERMLNLEHGPERFSLTLSAVAVGSAALIGIPGEPFTGIGVGLKAASGWDAVLPCGLMNGCIGYFPMKEAYDEGGYEARSSSFKAGVAELILEQGRALLDELRAQSN